MRARSSFSLVFFFWPWSSLLGLIFKNRTINRTVYVPSLLNMVYNSTHEQQRATKSKTIIICYRKKREDDDDETERGDAPPPVGTGKKMYTKHSQCLAARVLVYLYRQHCENDSQFTTLHAIECEYVRIAKQIPSDMRVYVYVLGCVFENTRNESETLESEIGRILLANECTNEKKEKRKKTRND